MESIDSEREKSLFIEYYMLILKSDTELTSLDVEKALQCTCPEYKHLKMDYDELFIKYRKDIYKALEKMYTSELKNKELRAKFINSISDRGFSEDFISSCLAVISDAYYLPNRFAIKDNKSVIFRTKDNSVIYKVTAKGLAILKKDGDSKIDGWYENPRILKKIASPSFWRNEFKIGVMHSGLY